MFLPDIGGGLAAGSLKNKKGYRLSP